MSLRVVSLNAWGGRLFEPLRRFLNEVNADVLCFQEVFSAFGTNIVALGDTDGYTVHANLFDEMAAIMPQHQGFFFTAARGYLNDSVTTDGRLSYGIATFVRKTLPIIGSQAGFVYGEFRPMPLGRPPLPRNAHCVRLWDYEADAALVVAHMHGLWDPRGKLDSPERTSQAMAFKSLVDQNYHGDDRLIVCGDFNLAPDSSLLEMFRSSGLSDLIESHGFTRTRTSYYQKGPAYGDYMLVSPQVRVRRFDVPATPEVSDHRPLILECA